MKRAIVASLALICCALAVSPCNSASIQKGGSPFRTTVRSVQDLQPEYIFKAISAFARQKKWRFHLPVELDAKPGDLGFAVVCMPAEAHSRRQVRFGIKPPLPCAYLGIAENLDWTEVSMVYPVAIEGDLRDFARQFDEMLDEVTK